THAPGVVDRLSSLALRYLKRQVAPPARPETAVEPAALAVLEGYYHPEGSRSAVFEPLTWLRGGTTIQVEGTALSATSPLGRVERWMPVSETLMRRPDEVTPSAVFTTDDAGRTVMLADGYYGVRTPRWQVEIVRVPVVLSLGLVATVPLAVIVWMARLRAARPSGFWALTLALALLPAALIAIAGVVLWVPARDWGTLNTWTRLVFLSTWTLPLASLVALALVANAWRTGLGPWMRGYAALVAAAGLALSAFLAVWGLVGLRPWTY
ncbi:MAG: hypothetical protein OEW19_05535, partial [Acidobacteriota bacterium]|nr:hypothetical protein [Acidobacteriota bacterium]